MSYQVSLFVAFHEVNAFQTLGAGCR